MTPAAPVARDPVGERVAIARRRRGLSQRDLAQALGVRPWTVDQIERGAGDASLYLHPIAAATEVRLDWLQRPTCSTHPHAATAGRRRARVSHLGAAGRGLVLGGVVLLVTIRFFTEVFPLLPRAANFVDVPLFLALVLAGVAVQGRASPGTAYLRLGTPALAFVLLAIGSAMVNAQRVAPAPALVFVYVFLAPLAVYAAVYRIWQPGHAGSFSRTLVGLGLLELAVVALVDLPRFFSSGDPDQISGTFGTNAYQLVFFLLVVAALLAGIFTLEPRRASGRLAPLLTFAVFAVIMLAQYRSLLATSAATMVLVGVLLGRHARGIVAAALAIVALALTFSYVASSFPGLKLEGTATTLGQDPWSYAAQRLEATRPIAGLYRDDPFVGAIGTGPGTFSSRAWQTFAKADSPSESNVAGGYAQRLTGGVYETDVAERYVAPQLRQGSVIEGSRALSSPYSSYLGLAAEVGLLGLALVAGVYVAALLRAARLARGTIARASGTDPVPALALATTIGFLTLLQMGFLENWLEVTRVTFVVWAMLAVVAKELDSRSEPLP